MIQRILLTVIMLGLCGTLHAQSAYLSGKWEFQVVTPFNTDQIIIDFTVDGNSLGGTVTRSVPPGQPPADLAGEIRDDKIIFTVTSPDGLRTITMRGMVNADEIEFTREATGAAGQGPGTGFYGLSGPATVIAKRVK